MDVTRSTQVAAVKEFWALHESGCFVLPNPWDVGSAVYLAHLGFPALATSSAGFAFTRGLPDGAVSRDPMLAHIADVVTATALPVNADFQSGYARAPEGVGENVALCVETGVAGLSIEDASGDNADPLYDSELAVERVRAARAAIDASGIPVLLTARCEAALFGRSDARRVVLERLVAYADAGADCLYAPGVRDVDEIAEIVTAVAPKPVNVLALGDPELTVARLADLGVRRVSVGAGLARAAWSGFIRAARELAEKGSFDAIRDATPSGDLNRIFG